MCIQFIAVLQLIPFVSAHLFWKWVTTSNLLVKLFGFFFCFDQINIVHFPVLEYINCHCDIQNSYHHNLDSIFCIKIIQNYGTRTYNNSPSFIIKPLRRVDKHKTYIIHKHWGIHWIHEKLYSLNLNHQIFNVLWWMQLKSLNIVESYVYDMVWTVSQRYWQQKICRVHSNHIGCYTYKGRFACLFLSCTETNSEIIPWLQSHNSMRVHLDFFLCMPLSTMIPCNTVLSPKSHTL